MSRPEWDDFFRGLAVYWSQMSTCSRRQVGAVVVKNKTVLGEGFNGVAPGEIHCTDGGCPRGQLSYDEVPAGADYNFAPCNALHAEYNAMDRAGDDGCNGAVLYVNAEPCYMCSAMIKKKKIAKVVIV